MVAATWPDGCFEEIGGFENETDASEWVAKKFQTLARRSREKGCFRMKAVGSLFDLRVNRETVTRSCTSRKMRGSGPKNEKVNAVAIAD